MQQFGKAVCSIYGNYNQLFIQLTSIPNTPEKLSPVHRNKATKIFKATCFIVAKTRNSLGIQKRNKKSFIFFGRIVHTGQRKKMK